MPNRQKRMQISKRINTLLKLCDCMSAIEYAKCEVCKELQKCGLELIEISKKSKTTIKKTILENDEIITDTVVITVNDYINYLRQGRTRKSLAIEFNTTEQRLRTWEKNNGITNIKSLKKLVR